MSAFTIKSVGDPKPWSNDFGSFLSYPVDLEDEGGKKHLGVEWSRKADSKAPLVEDQIAGHIESGQYGDKLKVDYDATKELKSGSTSSGGGNVKGGNWQPEAERDPGKTAVIDRGVSLKVAAAYCAGQGKPYPLSDLFSAANEIEIDLHKVRAKAAPSASPQIPDDTHQQLSHLLEEAGANALNASLLGNYAIEVLSETKLRDCVQALSGENGKTILAWLTSEYEKNKGPLPEATTYDDSIPF